jgi:hypothetical protein
MWWEMAMVVEFDGQGGGAGHRGIKASDRQREMEKRSREMKRGEEEGHRIRGRSD